MGKAANSSNTNKYELKCIEVKILLIYSYKKMLDFSPGTSFMVPRNSMFLL
jgi:hypothetical protein